MVAGISSPLRYKLAETSEGLANSIQAIQSEVTHYPAKERVGKSTLNANPVGWFSDRRRIPANSGICVARFQVWQDISACAGAKVASLHATVMFELSKEWYSSLSKRSGVIRIENAKHETIIEAELMVHQANYGLECAVRRKLQLTMSPTPLYKKLDANEIIGGTAQMKFWNRKVTIVLPETKILLIR